MKFSLFVIGRLWLVKLVGLKLPCKKITLIAQSVFELSHCDFGHNDDDDVDDDKNNDPSGLNYSPRRNVFRHRQKGEKMLKGRTKRRNFLTRFGAFDSHKSINE